MLGLILLQATTPGPIPWSGYLVCFLPLAAIILGFIAAAVVTDRHARRSYLRYTPGDYNPATKVDATKIGLTTPIPSDTSIQNEPRQA